MLRRGEGGREGRMVANIFVACYGYCGWTEGRRESTVIDWRRRGRERCRMASGRRREIYLYVCVCFVMSACVCFT